MRCDIIFLEQDDVICEMEVTESVVVEPMDASSKMDASSPHDVIKDSQEEQRQKDGALPDTGGQPFLVLSQVQVLEDIDADGRETLQAQDLRKRITADAIQGLPEIV